MERLQMLQQFSCIKMCYADLAQISDVSRLGQVCSGQSSHCLLCTRQLQCLQEILNLLSVEVMQSNGAVAIGLRSESMQPRATVLALIVIPYGVPHSISRLL